MTTYGPWRNGGTFDVTVDYGTVLTTPERGEAGGTLPTTFADACEVTAADSGSGGALLNTYLTSLVGAGVLYAVGTALTYPLYEASQIITQIRQTPLRDEVDSGDLAAYTGTVPSHAAVIYDDGTPAGTTVPQYTVSDADAEFGVPLNPDFGDPTLHPLAGTVDIRAASYLEDWLPGATLATRALLATAAASGTPNESADLHVAIAEADWTAVDAMFGGYMQRSVVLSSRAQISHATPVGTPAGLVTEGWAFYFGQPTLTVTATIRRSRFRFRYDKAPRLRQFPRDDVLGGAPRQGRANGSTSVQGSARQGWRGTYR